METLSPFPAIDEALRRLESPGLNPAAGQSSAISIRVSDFGLRVLTMMPVSRED
jgi:hypothetical protein